MHFADICMLKCNNERREKKKTKGGEWGQTSIESYSQVGAQVSLQMQYYQVKTLLGTKVEDEGPGN